MTQEEKDLLLKDISARLPYGLKVCCINLSDEMPKVWDLIGMPALHLADILVEGSHRFAGVNIEKSIRPYLRPMSSMTEKEKKNISHFFKSENMLVGAVYMVKNMNIWELIPMIYHNQYL